MNSLIDRSIVEEDYLFWDTPDKRAGMGIDRQKMLSGSTAQRDKGLTIYSNLDIRPPFYMTMIMFHLNNKK
jgi:hypothetical protein